MVSFPRRDKSKPATALSVSGGEGSINGDRLDAAFYRSVYADLNALDDEGARAHWLRHGRHEGRVPNPEALPADFNAISYLFLNRDLGPEFFDVRTAIRHYLEFGRREGRPYATTGSDPAFVASFKRHRGGAEIADPRLAWTPLALLPYLYVNGLSSDAFLRRFDRRFYLDAFVTEGRGEADPYERVGIDEAVFHFVENGIKQLHPIAPDVQFDVDFHRRQLRRRQSQRSTLDDATLYRLWLSDFDLDTYPPDHSTLMKMRFGVACGRNEILDLDVYRLANQDLLGLDDDALLEQLFMYGLTEQRSSIRITPTNALLLGRHARHLEEHGEADKAWTLYTRLIHFCPDLAALNHAFGDLLVRRGHFAQALQAYERNIASGAAGKWTYVNAAQCCDRLRDLKRMVEILADACRTFPDDEAMRRLWENATERHFADENAYARAVALSGRIAGGQAVLAAVAERCDVAALDPAPSRPIRSVGLFSNLDLSQCTLYRVEQKIEQLEAAGFEVRLYDWRHDHAAFHKELAALDAVIFFRVAAFPDVSRAIQAARGAGLVTFYEVDDLIFDPEAFPEPLVDYAGQITTEQYAELCLGVPLFRKSIQMCDYAIASTPALSRHMEPLVIRRRAFIHRNAIGRRHESAMADGRDVARRAGRAVTIFYGSGTKAHKLDFERILMPALVAIEREFGDAVQIVIAGHPPVGAGKAVLARARYESFTADIEDYWALLRTADIALSVLRRTPATSAKSEIKWIEAAMFGIPSVVSATDTFEEVITDGVDGYLAADTQAFIEKIATLVRDPKRRRAMGEAARQKVSSGYAEAAQAANLRAIFDAVVTPPVERTRVLVVNVYYAPQAKGGATRVVIDNVRDLRALFPDEFELEVFTTLEGGLDPYSVRVASHEGVRVTSMVAGDLPFGDNTAEDVRASEIFGRCVDRFRPHLIHFHCIQRITASAVEIARRREIPYFITAHDGWWISDRQFLREDEAQAPLYKFGSSARLKPGPQSRRARAVALFPALDGAEAILAVSESFAEIYRGTGLRNVISVPNGVPPLTHLQQRGERSQRAKVTLAHIGGLEAHKGFTLLRNALVAARPSNVTLLAVDLALETGDELMEFFGTTTVRFIGRRHQSEMANLYSEIDVLFAPSLWPESFGLVTREAVAAGCWVVASDRGAVADPVQDGINGHVVSVDDLRGLIDVIKTIDANPAKYLAPPPPAPSMRTSRDQARDLAKLYRDTVAIRPPKLRSDPAETIASEEIAP